MSIYTTLIMEATSCTRTEADAIEYCMRHNVFYGCLDAIDKKNFFLGAKKAKKMIEDSKK